MLALIQEDNDNQFSELYANIHKCLMVLMDQGLIYTSFSIINEDPKPWFFSKVYFLQTF